MAWRLCATMACGTKVKTGLVRYGYGANGRPLADGKHCAKCRAKWPPKRPRGLQPLMGAGLGEIVE